MVKNAEIIEFDFHTIFEFDFEFIEFDFRTIMFVCVSSGQVMILYADIS